MGSVEAVKEIGKLGSAGISLLEKYVDDKDWKVRQAVADVAGDLGKDGIEILNKLASDEDWEVRQTIADAAGKLGKDGIEILKQLVNDNYYRVRSSVASSAGFIGKDGLDILTELANDESVSARQAVAYAAGSLGKDGLNLLESLVYDENEEVREAVNYIAGELYPLHIYSRITKQVKNYEYYAVLKEIAEVAGDRYAAREILNQLVCDKDEIVRESANIVLDKIFGKERDVKNILENSIKEADCRSEKVSPVKQQER